MTNDAINSAVIDGLAGEAFSFVKDLLEPVDRIATKRAPLPFRSRTEHTWRVMQWARRLAAPYALDRHAAACVQKSSGDGSGGCEAGASNGDVTGAQSCETDVEEPRNCDKGDGRDKRDKYAGAVVDMDALDLAAAFHDSGYAISPDGKNHANSGADVFLAWASKERQRIPREGFIGRLIANHSKKALLGRNDTPFELVLLMEADLLDETGALSIVWDCLAVGEMPDAERSQRKTGYAAAYERIAAFGGGVQGECPLITPLARAIWAEKSDLARAFVRQLARDMGA